MNMSQAEPEDCRDRFLPPLRELLEHLAREIVRRLKTGQAAKEDPRRGQRSGRVARPR
jgi:hypothetical protein